MHDTLVYIIMGFVAVGFVIQMILSFHVAKSVFGRKDATGHGFIRNYVEGKILERHYRTNRIKD